MAAAYRFQFKRLDVYRLAVEHFRWTCAVVGRLRKGPWEVVNQAVSASLSIMGNVGEANGRQRKYGEVEQHYRYALGSTLEAAAHLDAFAALDVIDGEEYAEAEERLARIAAMLTSLAKRQRRQAAAKRRNAKRRTGAEETTKVEEPSPPAYPLRSEVAGRAQRARALDPRAAGPRASAASPGDRPPAERALRASVANSGDRPPAERARRGSEATADDRPSDPEPAQP